MALAELVALHIGGIEIGRYVVSVSRRTNVSSQGLGLRTVRLRSHLSRAFMHPYSAVSATQSISVLLDGIRRSSRPRSRELQRLSLLAMRLGSRLIGLVSDRSLVSDKIVNVSVLSRSYASRVSSSRSRLMSREHRWKSDDEDL